MVEDQENDVILIRLAFERAHLDCPIFSVPGGLQAIAYLSGDPPYQDRSRYPLPVMVLLDVRMPGIDGFEVLKWIRLRPEFEKLPVVMLTGSYEIRDANTDYQLVATSFLVKSVDFSNAAELSHTVKRLISCEQP